MALTFFTLIGNFTAVVARSVRDPDPNPFRQRISALVTLTPTTTLGGRVVRNGSDLEVRSEQDLATYVLRPILAKLVDGVLMNTREAQLNPDEPDEHGGELPDELEPYLDHHRYGIRLVANGPALDLPALDYVVRFSRVVFDKGDRRLAPFIFPAPNADEVVDLSTVHRTKVRDRALA